MSAAKSHAAIRWRRSTKFVRLDHLRCLRDCDKVAAVCYRSGRSGVEFLLVQTRGRRWTFPKGSAERGLTHAQAAALEAFEEAGVHGRMEELPFTRYTYDKTSTDVTVNAHLCEVTWLEKPQEMNRHPTWFSPEESKKRLRDDRKLEYGSALARVVDRAMTRIQRLQPRRLQPKTGTIVVRQKEALQKVTVIDLPDRLARKPNA
jgi:8-oxo-dGTP pyrophosphatase MutT (NUDIX family)